jgi:hypothetical protein
MIGKPWGILTAAAVLVLAACQPTPPPPVATATPPAPAVVQTAPVEAAGAATIVTAQGLYSATSTTAMGITGDITVTPDALAFAKFGSLRTVTLPAPAPGDAEAMKNQLLGLADFAELNVEVRKVDAATPERSAQPLCGKPVGYVMVATRRTDPGSLALIMFEGKDPPGGKDSNLCATFSFNRPG